MRVKIADSREASWVDFAEDDQVDIARALGTAAREKPILLQRWGDDAGKLHGRLEIFINGENIRYLNGMDTELQDGDIVYVIPLVAGG